MWKLFKITMLSRLSVNLVRSLWTQKKTGAFFFLQKHTYFFCGIFIDWKDIIMRNMMFWKRNECTLSKHTSIAHRTRVFHMEYATNNIHLFLSYFNFWRFFGNHSFYIFSIIIIFTLFIFVIILSWIIFCSHSMCMGWILLFFLCKNLAFSPKFDTFCIHYSEGTLIFRSSYWHTCGIYVESFYLKCKYKNAYQMGAYANFSIAEIWIHLEHVEHGTIPLEYTIKHTVIQWK